MKVIKLSYCDEIALVDDHWYERLMAMGRWLLLKTDHDKYAILEGSNRTIMMHNVVSPPPVGLENDHLDRNGLNNQESNLRHGTRSQNNANHGLNKNSTSGFKGVSLISRLKKWRAYIVKDYKQENIGYFISPEEAARAYDKRAKEIFGEFAKLNFPDS